MILQPCQLWALCLLLCVAVLFIPDRLINTRRRPNNGAVLLVIVASLLGMIDQHHFAVICVGVAVLVLMLDKIASIPSLEIKP
jgi:hypothetical protein